MLDWLRLIRASGMATIASNSLAAILTAFYAGEGDRIMWLALRLKHNGVQSLWILLASFLLYAAGMLWNDLIDVDRDRTGNPNRPLPSGRIGLVPAWIVGVLTMCGAMFAASHVDYGFFLAGVVLMLALLYNLVAKSLPWLGSVVMGTVRAGHACFALLLLGPDYVQMILTPNAVPVAGAIVSGATAAGTTYAAFVYPVILGIYIFGLTLVSEHEERQRRGSRFGFIVGGVAMAFALLAALGGLAGADWLPHLVHAGGPWPIAALLSVLFALGCAGWLGWTLFSAWLMALRSAKCELVGRVVVSGLGGMILLDAVIATAAHPLGGLLCAAFYPMFFVMGKLIRMN